MSYIFHLFFLFTLLILIMWAGGRCTLHIFGFRKGDWNPGIPPLRTPRKPWEHPSWAKIIHTFATEVTVGFAALGTLWVWLLLSGLFNRRLLLAVFGLLVAATLWIYASRPQRIRRKGKGPGADQALHSKTPTERLGKGGCLNGERRPLITALSTLELTFGALIAGALIVLALYPYQGYDFRAYQMPMATGYAETGGWQWFGDLRFPTFPPLMNLWFAVAILSGGDSAPVLAQLLALLPLFLLVSLCAAWAREKGAPFPTLAAALLLGSPLVIWAGSFGFIDLTMTLFTTLALYCLDRFQSSRDRPGITKKASPGEFSPAKRPSPSSDRSPYRWLILSGVMVGSAMNVKYLGAFFAPFIAVWIAGSWLISRSASNSATSTTSATPIASLIKTLGAFSLPAIAVASPWHLKTWFATGNPVFPFAKTVFGPNPWGWNLNVSVKDATTAVASFSTSLRWDSLNPWLLLVLPCTLFFLLKATGRLVDRAPQEGLTRSTVLLETASLSYLAFSLALSTDHRYILPSVVLLAILGALYTGTAIERLHTFLRQGERSHLLQTFVTTVFPNLLSVAFVALGVGFLGHTLLDRGSLPPAPSQYEPYLLDHIRGLPALRWAQEDYGASTIYRFGLNDLTVFSRSQRSIGDSSGTYSTLLLTTGLADRDNTTANQFIAEKLSEWDVDLILEERCGKSIPAAARRSMHRSGTRRPIKTVPIPGLFELVHSIDDVCLYRLRDSQEEGNGL